jgi:hypothetical protein
MKLGLLVETIDKVYSGQITIPFIGKKDSLRSLYFQVPKIKKGVK